MLAQVTAAAFGQRRKMLRSSLKQLLADPEQLLEAAGIAGNLRAEDLERQRLRPPGTCLRALGAAARLVRVGVARLGHRQKTQCAGDEQDRDGLYERDPGFDCGALRPISREVDDQIDKDDAD